MRDVSVLHLETNSSLVEAISLYLSAGYVEVAKFNDEPHSDHWFEKRFEQALMSSEVERRALAIGTGHFGV